MKKLNIFDDRLAKFILCVIVICSMYIVPTLIYSALINVIKHEMLCNVISNVIYTLLLILVFYKELVSEFKLFKSNFKETITKSFKWYFIGLCLMLVFNLILTRFLGGISNNEQTIREYINIYPLYTLISVMIVAPISEELIFRKSIMRTTNNKWIGSIICGLLFGFAHVIDYVYDSPISVLYMLPYAALGFVFAMMDYENKSVYPSILYHSFHNTFSFIAIILMGLLG